jgi:hypothetical protein
MRGLVVTLLVLVLLLGALPARAAFVGRRVTVAVTATLLYTAPGFGGKVLIRNPSAVSVYVGPAAVLTTTGFEIAAGDALSVNVYPNDAVYGIVAAATEIVHIVEGNAR